MEPVAVHPPLVVVLGPTASGKSALALEVARRAGAEILCVDSMTVYRHMDIGTAKPSPAEQALVRHHLLDVVTPEEEFTVSRFVTLADEVIAEARRRQTPLVLTGGTPLYYKALFDGLFEGPGADEAVRARLRQEDPALLHRRLSEIDPAAAQRIHANDTKRLIRALEVYELTGKPISTLQTEWERPQHRHPALWVGLQWEKEELNRRINARVKAMMQAGWLQEVQGLRQRYPRLSKTAGEATGYAELIAHLTGELSLEDATERTKIGTRQLARRQMKWFRRFGGVTWLEGNRPLEELAARVMELWARPA